MKVLKRIFIALSLFITLFALGIYMLIQLFQPNSHDQTQMDIAEDLSVERFIGTIGETARELADENNLYASVMIAQAILESDKGRSGLASEPNYNLFGMKGTYKNESVTFETLEDDGQGNMSTIQAKFRKYPSYEASMEDYVKLLRNGVSWNEKFYEQAFKSNASTYQEVTRFLTGTYATDSRYEAKLNAIIEQYDLTQYDYPEVKEKQITVVSNESLDRFAEKHNVTVTALKQWNQLQSSNLSEGQIIKVYEPITN